MPELPEVESFRKYVAKTSLNKVIEGMKLGAPRSLLEITEKKLRQTLVGNHFTGTFRHGKFLFIQLAKGGNLLLHFGLTGDLIYSRNGDDLPEKFSLQLHFTDDSNLFFTDQRKMGKIGIVDDITAFIDRRGYGADALKINKATFLELIKKKNAPIKSVLMDQNIVAGVGNEFSDEILFQTKIHPSTKPSALSQNQLSGIFEHMTTILKKAVSVNADRE
jgi:formamidopyrimidine-DNA glycosylase